MIEIPLTHGRVALVDDADAGLVSGYKWHFHKSPRSDDGYARSRTGGKRVFMHHLIFGARPGVLVDHENGNGLDNRRSNLRPATRFHNARNSRKRKGMTSRFKGVSRRGHGWKAAIHVNGKTINLGCTGDEVEAAYLYDIAARKHFGEFAATNFDSVPADFAPTSLIPRKTGVCKQGHVLTGEHVYVAPGGKRRCRTCANERTRKWRAQQNS